MLNKIDLQVNFDGTKSSLSESIGTNRKSDRAIFLSK
jgi:hypothetical protein